MRLIIHIGTEKTGTSSIQEFLFANPKALARSGIAYLTSPMESAKRIMNSRCFATYCLADEVTDDHVRSLGITEHRARQAWKERLRHSFKKAIQNLAYDVNTVIISSEHFHSRLHSEQEIHRLAELVKDHFSRIELVAYLRRQDVVAVSHYSTICRSGGTRRNILPQVDKDNNYYNYYRFINRWVAVFGKEGIRLRVFERSALRNTDVVDDFLDTTDISLGDGAIVRPKPRNESISAVAQEVVLVFNRYFPRFTEGDQWKDFLKLRQKLIAQLQATHPGHPKLPSRSDALAFFRTFDDSNAKLAQEYFNRSQLFNSDFSAYPDQPEEPALDNQALEDIFSTLRTFVDNNRARRQS